MTNKEYIIKKITKNVIYANEDEVKQIFEIINHRDWIYFTSQMGDYDHYEERRVADEEMKKKLEEYQNVIHKDIIPSVEYWMEYDHFTIGKFYHEHFHTLNDRCTVRSCLRCTKYNEEYPDPCCIRCRTGWNDNYEKPDYFEEID